MTNGAAAFLPSVPPALDAPVPRALTHLPLLRRFSPTVLCSGHPDAAQLDACAKAGVEVVINLSLHGQPYSLPDEAALLATLDVDYVHIPVPFDAPDVTHLAQFISAMHVHAGRSTLVHCVVNKRATAFLALYAIHHGGKAEEWVWWLRETWAPEEATAWGAFLAQTLDGAS